MAVGRISVGLVTKGTRYFDMRVDRASVLGNPFVMKNKTQAERDRVCNEYEEYFNIEVKKPGAFRDKVISIYTMVKNGCDINLQCWCAPKRCHADTIKQFIEDNLKKAK